MGGYPPGLPPLQGPVDGLVSMGSMQPLHPGGPPPHHLPPGVPGLPGIPPPGKNFILIHSLISYSYSPFPPSASCSRRHLLPIVGRASFTENPRDVSSRACPVCWAGDSAPVPVGTWLPSSSTGHMAETRSSRPRDRRHTLKSHNLTCTQKAKHSLKCHALFINEWSSQIASWGSHIKAFFAPEFISSSGSFLISQGLLYRVPAPSPASQKALLRGLQNH